MYLLSSSLFWHPLVSFSFLLRALTIAVMILATTSMWLMQHLCWAQVTVLSAGTGSGKTTQVIQYLYEDFCLQVRPAYAHSLSSLSTARGQVQLSGRGSMQVLHAGAATDAAGTGVGMHACFIPLCSLVYFPCSH
jgi:hypothetical protein